jgi:hypothetical protein
MSAQSHPKKIVKGNDLIALLRARTAESRAKKEVGKQKRPTNSCIRCDEGLYLETVNPDGGLTNEYESDESWDMPGFCSYCADQLMDND